MATAVPDRLEHGDKLAALVSRRGEPTWEIARTYPYQGEWTEEDYLAVRDHLNGSVELSDGCLEFLPIPSLRHQFIIEFLFDSLRAHVRRTGLAGRAVAFPLPVQLWKGLFREPDVVYLKQERIANVDRQPTGADLVHGEFKVVETATSVLLNGFPVAVDEVFAAGEGATRDASVPEGRG